MDYKRQWWHLSFLILRCSHDVAEIQNRTVKKCGPFSNIFYLGPFILLLYQTTIYKRPVLAVPLGNWHFSPNRTLSISLVSITCAALGRELQQGAVTEPTITTQAQALHTVIIF